MTMTSRKTKIRTSTTSRRASRRVMATMRQDRMIRRRSDFDASHH